MCFEVNFRAEEISYALSSEGVSCFDFHIDVLYDYSYGLCCSGRAGGVIVAFVLRGRLILKLATCWWGAPLRYIGNIFLILFCHRVGTHSVIMCS